MTAVSNPTRTQLTTTLAVNGFSAEWPSNSTRPPDGV